MSPVTAGEFSGIGMAVGESIAFHPKAINVIQSSGVYCAVIYDIVD